MRVYYDRDADINLIKGKKVAIIGYGSQGHAHALNLRDSGVKDVAVALRKGSQGIKKAEAEKLKVMEAAEAARWADVMMMLTPDELQADIYRDHLAANMKDGAALMFAQRFFQTPTVFVYILVMLATGLVLDAVMLRLRHRLIPWDEETA